MPKSVPGHFRRRSFGRRNRCITPRSQVNKNPFEILFKTFIHSSKFSIEWHQSTSLLEGRPAFDRFEFSSAAQSGCERSRLAGQWRRIAVESAVRIRRFECRPFGRDGPSMDQRSAANPPNSFPIRTNYIRINVLNIFIPLPP